MMLKAIEAEIKEAVTKRKQGWEQLDTGGLKPDLQTLFEKMNQRDKNVVLTYLKSSYVTKSHRFKLAVYEGAPFVELYPSTYNLNMSVLFQDIEADLDRLHRKLRQQFFRMMASEEEEIRRYYMELLYLESATFFKQLFLEFPKDIPLPPIYFGAELGEVRLLEEL